MYYPGSTGSDRAYALCLLITPWLRRVRTGLMMQCYTVHTGGTRYTLKGEPVDDVYSLLLDQFCSQPVPRWEICHLGDRAQYALSGDIFFFNDTATTEIYTLSLHDALPI